MDTQDLIQLLQRQGITPTRQRIDIAKLLFQENRHICADTLIEELATNGSATPSKATVYNTLNLFSRHGLVNELYLDSGKILYDTNTSGHQHVYNVETGELWDVQCSSEIDTGLQRLPAGTECVGVDVVYRVRSSL